METVISGILISSITAGTVIIFAALGELLAEQTGVMNLGLEGIMAMGAVTAIIVVNNITPNAYIALGASILVGLLFGILFAFATVTLKANQVLCGLALSFVGTGLAGHIGRPFAAFPAADRFQAIKIPALGDIPIIGNALFNQNLLVYIAYLLMPLICAYILYMTRHGINLRAVGENPSAADASGISVNKIRFLYVSLGAAFSGVAGAYLTLGLTTKWTDGVTAGSGWIAIALVIFSGWNPFIVLFGALLFGSMTSVGFIGQIQGWGIPSSILAMLPYIMTILLMAISSIRGKKIRSKDLSVGPTSLAQPYYRE
jgi:simple sugar transport system permease protein